MIIRLFGDDTIVRVSRQEIEAFKREWPRSGLPSESFCFRFSKYGNLIWVEPRINSESASFLLELVKEHIHESLEEQRHGTGNRICHGSGQVQGQVALF